jgi:hypothetical protein
MKVIASRQIPIINTRQVVWQPVAENGDLSMRLAPIDWQPSGAHACIQMLADDLRDAEAKLAKAMEALRFEEPFIGPRSRATLAELEGK